MADKTLDRLFDDALQTRIKGVPGGNIVHWGAKDRSVIKDYFVAHRDSVLSAATARRSANVEAVPAGRTFSVGGVTVTRDAQASDLRFLGRYTCKVVDLVGDVVFNDGVDSSDFNKNPVIAGFHNTSSALPVATSSQPYASGDSLLGVINFPSPGVSAASDEMAAAVRAKLIRGISIGFQPLAWKFSKDPARPLGVDFLQIRLLEASLVPIPCCPPCLVLGAVTGKSATKSTPAGNVLQLSKPSDREARMAEAARLRRQAYRV
jgi:hypothetical protein